MATWIEDYFERNPDVAALPVVGRARHGVHLRRSGRRHVALLTGAPMHYFDGSSRSWQPINTSLRVTGDGRFAAAGLPFSLSLDGDVKVEGQAHRHKAWRVGVLADGRFMPLHKFGEGKLHGDRILRQAGPMQHEIIVLPSGLKEQLTLFEKPDLANKGSGLFVIESLLPEAVFPDGWLDEHSRGSLRYPRGWAQAADGTRIPLMRWAQTHGGMQRLYSGVPLEWLDVAAYPMILDPDIEIASETADATIEGGNTTTSTLIDVSSSSITAGGRTFGGYPHVWRAYLKFNTSSLGPSAEVEQANLRLYPTAINAYIGWTIYVRQYNWSAIDPLSDGNRETAWDGLYATGNTAVMATSADPVGTPVTSQPLPTTWINVVGNTYYGLWNNQEGYAYPNNQGGQHQYASGNYPTPSQRPLLVLEYLAGYPRTGPLPVRGVLPQPRVTLAETRRILRARSRRVSLHTNTH